ncbi:VOC family protein [soil metagenome]
MDGRFRPTPDDKGYTIHPPDPVTMKSVSPYLNFPGNSEEAFNFYKSVFGGEPVITRFKDLQDNSMGVPERDLDKIANIALPLGSGCVLMATDVIDSMPTQLTVGNNFYITLEPESIEEAESLFNALAEGGAIEMPLMKTEWAEKYGICADKFGIQWMINYGGNVEAGCVEEETEGANAAV